ncbi:MAG: phosphoenolpyruvate--protein phosphotransferase [Mycoplasmoidaceae bacterium]|nr:phosphoenolpyruvate--protein phosphotransferase [Mycoplasmoidaceae bacterium]
MTKYSGKTIFEGFANGVIKVLINSQEVVKRTFTTTEQEFVRFLSARDKEIAKLDALYTETKAKLGEDKAKLFATHKIMAQDLDFEDSIKGFINNQKTAEEAVDLASKQFAGMLSQLDDPYMKARSADVLEIGKGVIDILSGKENDYRLTEPTILVCEDLESSTIMQFDKTLLKGLVLTKGNPTAHVSIFARSSEIPSICMTKDLPLDKSLNGKKAILDSTKGEVMLDVSPEDEANYSKQAQDYAGQKEALKSFIGKPSVTKDGVKTKIYCNIASAADTATVVANDGEGIGVFRSEYVYLKQTDYPSEDFQFEVYKKALEAMKGKEVIIRTFDIGADKKVPYFDLPAEANPALGYRSVRICLDKPDMFKTQLRALYRASAFGKLSIMVPMITNVSEIDFCKKCIEEVKKDLDAKQIPYAKDVKLGIMIEVPVAAVCADELAQHVDFFSIGTNDLTQYALACDRVNPNLTKVYDPYHKGLMRLIKMTIDAAHKYGKEVGMCGELARDPKVLPFLIALHIDEISLSAPYVLQTRKAISELDTTKINIDDYIK